MDSLAPTLISTGMGALQQTALPLWCAAARDRSGMSLLPVSRHEHYIVVFQYFIYLYSNLRLQ